MSAQVEKHVAPNILPDPSLLDYFIRDAIIEKAPDKALHIIKFADPNELSKAIDGHNSFRAILEGNEAAARAKLSAFNDSDIRSDKDRIRAKHAANVMQEELAAIVEGGKAPAAQDLERLWQLDENAAQTPYELALEPLYDAQMALYFDNDMQVIKAEIEAKQRKLARRRQLLATAAAGLAFGFGAFAATYGYAEAVYPEQISSDVNLQNGVTKIALAEGIVDTIAISSAAGYLLTRRKARDTIAHRVANKRQISKAT